MGEPFLWSRVQLAIDRVAPVVARLDNDAGFQGSGHVLTADDVKVSDVALLLEVTKQMLAVMSAATEEAPDGN